MKKKQIPSSQFTEEEADRLIASYREKLSPARRHELNKYLRSHKEQFIERLRQRKDRSGPERGL